MMRFLIIGVSLSGCALVSDVDECTLSDNSGRQVIEQIVVTNKPAYVLVRGDGPTTRPEALRGDCTLGDTQ